MGSHLSAIIFDLDGTLTTVPSPWRYIHERLGVWESSAHVFSQQWLAGEIPYEEFCRRDLSLWSGRTVQEIEALLDEIAISRHVPEVIRRLMEARIPSIIVSSGFRYVAAKIQNRWSWHPLLIYANDLLEGPSVRINVSPDIESPVSKKALALEALERVGGRLDGTLVVSDSQHDLDQLKQCRYRLLVRSEEDLLKVTEFLLK